MTWIAQTDLATHVFAPQGIGKPEPAKAEKTPVTADEILPVGTLLIEARSRVDAETDQPIIHFHAGRPWLREMDVTLQKDGVLSLEFTQGTAQSQAHIRLPYPPHDSRMRITYSWNAPKRTGRLTVELLDLGQLFQVSLYDPVPLPLADIRIIARNGGRITISQSVEFIAVSDAVEPVGFGMGVTSGTLVETAHGAMPVERLRLGDEVVTATSGLRPVRWIGKREVPALGSLRPVLLRAPFFGLERDLLLAPDHRLRLDFDDADYMLGTDDVLLAASHLVNGKQAHRDDSTPLVTYYQVLLDVHDCLLHHGIWGESLFVGTIRRRPDVAATTVLGDLPASALPEHRAFSRHQLSTMEARSLAATLRA
ncbi:MAG: Hint domain-containing protein [Maritimibacter sp.]